MVELVEIASADSRWAVKTHGIAVRTFDDRERARAYARQYAEIASRNPKRLPVKIVEAALSANRPRNIMPPHA